LGYPYLSKKALGIYWPYLQGDFESDKQNVAWGSKSLEGLSTLHSRESHRYPLSMSPQLWKRFEKISAIFIPLGVIGGIFQQSITQAIGSGIIWFIIFTLIRNRNRKNGISI